jgi:hypothetical protein
MSPSKKIDLSRDFAAGVIRVNIHDIHSVMFVFSVQLCELLPLSPSLWFNSPHLPPFPVWISILYTCTLCKGGGGVWVSVPQIDQHLPQSPFTGQFFKMTSFAFTSMSLIFLHTCHSMQILGTWTMLAWRNNNYRWIFRDQSHHAPTYSKCSLCHTLL